MEGIEFVTGGEAIQLMQYCMSHGSDNMMDVVWTSFILPTFIPYTFFNGHKASSKSKVVPTTQYLISDAAWASFRNFSLKSVYNVFMYGT